MSDRTHPDSGPVTPGEAGFTAADMATAAAQGFRDGRASRSLPAAGQEPVACAAHIAAMERAWLWMENQADGQSKGGHATFDLMMLREERDALRAAIDMEVAKKSCPHCDGSGEVFGHAESCSDELCALNGDIHSCAGKVEPCQCVARAAPQPAVAAGWVPIETAPVAGLILLVVEDSAGERRVFPAEASHENGVLAWQVTLGWLGWTRLHSGWTPILWRRIPTPPTTSAGSGKGE